MSLRPVCAERSVSKKKKRRSNPGIILWLIMIASVVLSACSVSPSQINTSTPAATISTASQTPEVEPTAVPVQVEHHIGVRQVNGVGEFYNKQTDEKFIPRGVNYVFVPVGNGYSNLPLRVGIYDPQRTRDDFAKLANLGYNTVRVFLDQCNAGPGCIGDDDNDGLNPEYLDNIADMMSAAHETGIYILFTSNDLPDQGGYSDEANSASGGTFAGYRNSYYLTPPAISATRRYWSDLLTDLIERNAAFDVVLGWQLLNEQWMFADQPPLSLPSGMVQTTTGTYDMSDPEQKVQMVDDGLVYYIAQMKEEILIHDPTALVTMGFFTPEIAAPGWYVETTALLQRADLDFFDFHWYPGGPLSFETHAKRFGMIGYDEKPIILGEYGSFRHIYTEVDSAARAATLTAAESCAYGFDGWLYWTYYPANANIGDRTWGLVDEDDYLLNLFAPVNQPDVCLPVDVPNDNLAFGKPVTASRSLPEEPPENAVDDNAGTQWGAGDGPVQWIQIELQGSYRITEIRLIVAQYPAGNTIHRVQVRSSSEGAFETVHEFNDSTNEGEQLVFEPNTPIDNVSQIRIQTIASPSWVAWKEIEVYGEPMP
jgi:hypothetical protein